MSLKLINIALICAILSGCAAATDNAGNLLGAFSVCTSNPNNTAANIMATWVASCTAWSFSSGTPISWLKNSLTFSGSTVTETIGIYTDAQCSTLNAQYTTVVSGSFAIGTVSTLKAANNVDITVTQVTITPNSNAQATTYNTSSFCGITSWTSGVATDVTGKNTGQCVYPSTGSSILQIFGLGVISGSSLYCGTPVNGAVFGSGPNSTATSGVILSGSSSTRPSAYLSRLFSQ